MPLYKVVLDDMMDQFRKTDLYRKSDPAVVEKLTFGITFSADSREHAELIIRGAGAPGRWHIESVDEVDNPHMCRCGDGSIDHFERANPRVIGVGPCTKCRCQAFAPRRHHPEPPVMSRTCPDCGETWFGHPTTGYEGPGVGPDRSKCRVCGCVWTGDGTIVAHGSASVG